MSTVATVTMIDGRYVATLTNGVEISRMVLEELAESLVRAGVPSGCIRFIWSPGHRMITAGQQVALLAEVRRLYQVDRSLFCAA